MRFVLGLWMRLGVAGGSFLVGLRVMERGREKLKVVLGRVWVGEGIRFGKSYG